MARLPRLLRARRSVLRLRADELLAKVAEADCARIVSAAGGPAVGCSPYHTLMARAVARAKADLFRLAGARPLDRGERMIGAAALRRHLASLSGRDDAAKDLSHTLVRDRLTIERSCATVAPHDR